MSSIRIVICAAWLWFSFKRLIQYCSWMKLLFFSVFVLLRNKRVISGSHILRDRIQLIGALQTYQVITNHQQCNVFCKSDESLPSVIWKKKIHLFSCINTYRMCINTPPTPGQNSKSRRGPLIGSQTRQVHLNKNAKILSLQLKKITYIQVQKILVISSEQSWDPGEFMSSFTS